jgi:hypothetical protein
VLAEGRFDTGQVVVATNQAGQRERQITGRPLRSRRGKRDQPRLGSPFRLVVARLRRPLPRPHLEATFRVVDFRVVDFCVVHDGACDRHDDSV